MASAEQPACRGRATSAAVAGARPDGRAACSTIPAAPLSRSPEGCPAGAPRPTELATVFARLDGRERPSGIPAQAPGRNSFLDSRRRS